MTGETNVVAAGALLPKARSQWQRAQCSGALAGLAKPIRSL